jgi:flavin-binding protein dodecin
MAKRICANWRVLSVVVLSAGLLVVALTYLMPSTPAQTAAAIAVAPCGNPAVFTGTDSNGDFQAALEDAIAQAERWVPCCDRIMTYRVVDTTGRRGGIAGFNDISVQIIASY